MENKIKKAFTLIELLVVITIIWILATWATSIFTSQIQKARDSTRLNDVKALRWAVEQAYQDDQEYPHTKAEDFKKALSDYIDKFPTDPKKLQSANKSGYENGNEPSLWYTYIVWNDENWIENSTYEISTAFEANWSIDWKAKTDKWNDNNRMEIWINTDTLKTSMKKDTPCQADNEDSSVVAIVINEWKFCKISSANQY